MEYSDMNKRVADDSGIIRSSLRQTEGAFDEALLETTTLMQAMIRARQNPDVAVHTGQGAIVRLTRIISRTVEAASDVFRVHDEMSRVGIAYGVLDEDGSTPPSGLDHGDEPAFAGHKEAA